MIAPYGIAIDAEYDPRLDRLVPGYKLINVAIVNNSFRILLLSPEQDRWTIRAGKKQRSIIDLKEADFRVWNELPEALQRLISYPLAVPIGARMVVDLLVPERVDLMKLSAVYAEIASLGVTFEIDLR